MSPSARDPTTLGKTFHFESSTHYFDVRWTSLGSPISPPIIFIHGTPWSSRLWVPFALALSHKYNVYLFDNPGFGDSPIEQLLPNVNFSPKDEVERLDSNLARQTSAFAALFKHWQATEGWKSKPHVIAHDHGGLMSLRAHLLYACQYNSLCLMDVVAIGPFGQPLFKSVADNPEAFENLPNMAFEGILESYIRNAAHTVLNSETMRMLKAAWLAESGQKGFVRQLCQAACRSTEEVEGRYAEVGRNLPVKIIWGKQDNWIPVADAHRLGEALGAKEVAEIEGAGHLIMYDQPAQVGVELGVWLASANT
jgi:pimeloyl-ACP methyl ester carboxylesterase